MKSNKKMLIGCAIVVLSILTILTFSGCLEEQKTSDKSKILLSVTIINEETSPTGGYFKKEGEPTEVYIYEAVPDPELTQIINFTKIGTISLQKINDTHYTGKKYINHNDLTLCVGYATTNFIDGMSCVMINQSLNEVQLQVYYWDCYVGVG